MTKLEDMPEDFQKAVFDGKHLTSRPDNNDLLECYGLYKQALQDPPIEGAEKIGMFDLKAKAKRAAWQKLVTKGVSPEDAAKDYIKKIKEMMVTYGYDPEKEPEPVGGV